MAAKIKEHLKGGIKMFKKVILPFESFPVPQLEWQISWLWSELSHCYLKYIYITSTDNKNKH